MCRRGENRFVRALRHRAPVVLSNQPLDLTPSRAREIRTHVAEAFWSIEVVVGPTRGSQPEAGPVRETACKFAWDRGHLFDQVCAQILHEICLAEPHATVVQVSGAQKTKWAPCPLSTLEMQKRGSQVGEEK